MKNWRKQPLISLHVFQFYFTPTLFPTIAFLILLPILITLGLWQLDRAEQKKQILRQFKLGEQITITQKELGDKHESLAYKKIILTGHYDNHHQFLLDNQVVNQHVGYDVITPFKLNNGKIILVNRGFIARNQDRTRLPKLDTIHGTQTIHGIIKQPPKKIFLLGSYSESTTWPRVIQALDIKQLSQTLPQPVIPLFVLLSKKSPHGFIRHWKILPIKPQKHLGYAIQWFSLALTLVIIYIIVNTRRGRYSETRK